MVHYRPLPEILLPELVFRRLYWRQDKLMLPPQLWSMSMDAWRTHKYTCRAMLCCSSHSCRLWRAATESRNFSRLVAAPPLPPGRRGRAGGAGRPGARQRGSSSETRPADWVRQQAVMSWATWAAWDTFNTWPPWSPTTATTCPPCPTTSLSTPPTITQLSRLRFPNMPGAALAPASLHSAHINDL